MRPAEDRCERRAKLVTDSRQELVFHLAGQLGLDAHPPLALQQPFPLGLGPLSVCDIYVGREYSVGLAVRGPRHRDAVADPDVRPVRPHVPLLDEKRQPVPHRLSKQCKVVGEVVGMRDVLHTEFQQFLTRAADDLGVPVIGEDEPAAKVHLRDPGRRLLEYRPQSLLALPQRFLGNALLGHVAVNEDDFLDAAGVVLHGVHIRAAPP